MQNNVITSKDYRIKKEEIQLPKKDVNDNNNNDDLSRIDKFIELYKKSLFDIEVGTTAYTVVLETRLYRLLHYKPFFKKPIRIPILVVYALINRSYILDLQPDKSWIRNLLIQGFDVYLVDWKPATQNDKYVSFDDYVNCFIDDCVDFIRNTHFTDKINLHGYCMGATMSTMYCALNQHKVKNLVTLAPVIDSGKDHTVMSNFAKHMDVDRVIDSTGNMLPELMHLCFSTLKPFKQGVNKYYTLLEHIDDDRFVKNFLRIEKWLYDVPPIAGETFKQWIKDIYQNNLLVKNEMRLGRKLVDVSDITVPFLNIVADEDHMVSPECSATLNNLVSSSDNRLLRFPTGHVGLIASSYSQVNVLPRLGRWFFTKSVTN